MPDVLLRSLRAIPRFAALIETVGVGQRAYSWIALSVSASRLASSPIIFTPTSGWVWMSPRKSHLVIARHLVADVATTSAVRGVSSSNNAISPK